MSAAWPRVVGAPACHAASSFLGRSVVPAARPHSRVMPLPSGSVQVTEQSPYTAPHVEPTVVADEAPIVFDVTDVNFWYGAFQALREVTLDVRCNEITALIGP